MRILKRRCTDCKDPLPPGVTGLCDVCLEMAELDEAGIPHVDGQVSDRVERARDEAEVIDYTRALPGAGLGHRPAQGRQRPQHDHVTRMALKRAVQNPGPTGELPSWDELSARHQDADDYHVVEFHGNESTSNPFYQRRKPARAPDFPAAAGELFTPRAAVNTGANGHLFDRWGKPR